MLIYIAFFKRSVEGCLGDDKDENGDPIVSSDYNCTKELYTQLISVFLVTIAKNLVEVRENEFTPRRLAYPM